MTNSENDREKTQTHVVITPGSQVSHYKVIERIGSGGMGEVFLADDTKLTRRVALKFLPHHLATEPEARSRFVREAQAAAKLDHPNIVTIHEVGEYEGRPYFAMQYIDGKSLHHYCHDEPLSISKIIEITIQICEGLAKAHHAGIIHRDIKSANILVDSDLRPKILDFGLAAVRGGEKLTKVGSTLGTVAYMSPEQAQGLEVDQRSDLFSLGIVLYEMITGRTPFKRDNDAATLKAIVSDDAEPLARYRSNVPEELQRIVARLLERDRSLRYQTASGVMADLKKLAISSSSGRVSPVARKRAGVWPYVAAVAIIAIAAVIFWSLKGTKESQFSALSNMTITPLTNDGKVASAAISPDGKYVAYVREDAGTYSLWIKQIATASIVQILEPVESSMGNVAFSPDGNFVFYTRQDSAGIDILYRIPVLGGTPKLILADLYTKVSFSPDGTRMTFCRIYMETGEFAIMVGDVDGGNVKKLAAKKADEWYFGTPSWSPDGKLIACRKGYLKPHMHEEVVVLDAATGDETWQSSGDWSSVNSPTWLPDGKGLLLGAAARSSPSVGTQIRQVSYPSARPRSITNDLNSYSGLTLTAEGDKLAAVQYNSRGGIWFVPGGEASQARQLTFGKDDGFFGLTWADSGIIYPIISNDRSTVNRVSLDGSAPQELMASNSIIWDMSVSPDGRYLVFVELTEGIPSIWRADIKGQNKKRLTSGAEHYSPKVSPDGKWVVFESWEAGPVTLMRTSIDGGERLPVTKNWSQGAAISPDGRLVACFWREQQNAPPKIALVTFEGGDPVKFFDWPPTASTPLEWTSDGTAIMYVNTLEGISNIWNQPIDGSAPQQITHFKENQIAHFSWSPDGKNLAVCRANSTSDVVLISNFR